MTKEALKDLLDAVEAAIKAGDWKVDGVCDPDLAIRRAKQALAQPDEQLLISNILSNYGLQAIDFVADFKEAMKQAEQEHPAPCTKHCEATAFQITIKNLEAQLAQRTWVGLTNNDLQPIAEEYRILFGSWVHDFARAIEAKLKEKNT